MLGARCLWGEQKRALLFAANDGEAGALDLYGPRLGLPRPVSNVSSFHRWGLHRPTGEIAVIIGSDREDVEEYYARWFPPTRSVTSRAIWYETDLPIWIAREPKRSLAEA